MMPESRSAKFLDLIRRSDRGRLKVYLGYGPGVGKTYQMLQVARRLKQEGIDIVVGLVETHGRKETEQLIGELEVLPRRRVEYHGITVEEFDVDACLARKPQVAVVDELAHSNVPGSRNQKRYEDVQELLAAGIHVITAMNVQHLESLYNTVEGLVGVKVRERVPDSVLAEADQVVNIDVSPEDLQERLHAGKIYPKERIATSLENFFQTGNLEHLRELALRELASQIDFRRRERPEAAAPSGNDQIMVCLSSRGPSSARLLRYGSRLAGRLNRNWYAVYVQTPSEEPTRIDATTQRLLADTLTLANQLGATVFTFKGVDIPETILRFAKEYRVGQVVIGKPHPIPWWKRLFLGRQSVAEQLIYKAQNVSVIVVDAEAQEMLATDLPAAPTSDSASNSLGQIVDPKRKPSLRELLTENHIVILNDAPTRDQVLKSLMESISSDHPELNVEAVLKGLTEREAQGSTFLNEGVALPHAKIQGLLQPLAALAVTPAGVIDAPVERPVEAVFLLLSPADAPTSHLQILGTAARLLQKRELRGKLSAVESKAEAHQLILASIKER